VKRTTVAILLILILALALRLIALETRSLWYDEAFAVLFAEKGLEPMLYGTLTPVDGGAADIHPLLYYTTLNVWMTIFGQSPVAVRLWSIIIGLMTIYVLFRLARDLFGEQTALATALITAIAPFHVQYSQETRMYSLQALLLVSATWVFVRAWRGMDSPQPRWGLWISFGVLCALAMYTQQLSAFYLAALGLFPLLTRRRELFLRLCVGVIVALVLYLPWLINIPAQLAKVGSYYWLTAPELADVLVTLRSFTAGYLEFTGAAGLITLIAALLLVIFLIVQVVLYLRRPRRATAQAEPAALLLTLWLFAVPIMLMWLFSQQRPVYLDRGLIGSALMLYAALGWLFTKGGLPRPIRIGLIAIGLIASVIGLYTHYTWAIFPNSPFQTASAYVQSQLQTGDVIVHQDKMSALPMIYYARDLPQYYLGDLPGASDDTLARPTQEALNLLAEPCIQAAVVGAQRVWWVVFPRAEQEAREQNAEGILSQIEWMRVHYREAERHSFNDLDVILYTDPDITIPSAECPSR
jgi:mannosyltransferase